MTSAVKRSVPPPTLVKMGNPLELKDAAREYGWSVITLTPR